MVIAAMRLIVNETPAVAAMSAILRK